MGEEQNDLIDIFSEERERRVAEEENLKKQLEVFENHVPVSILSWRFSLSI